MEEGLDKELLVEEKKDFKLYKSHLIFLFIAFITIISMLIREDLLINIIKGGTVAFALAYFSAEDLKSKTIGNKGLIIFLIIGMIETFVTCDIQVYLDAIISTVIMSIIMFILYFMAHGNFGSGDVKLIIIITIFLNFITTIQMIFMALVLTVIVGIVLVILRKGSFKMEMPMVPFLSVAYMLNTIMEVFL